MIRNSSKRKNFFKQYLYSPLFNFSPFIFWCSKFLLKNGPKRTAGKLAATLPITLASELMLLKHQKMKGLKLYNDEFDTNVALNAESRKEICWWINNIFESFASVNILDPDIKVYTDASLLGWGITDCKTSSGGRWDENEITPINMLELKAIQFKAY